VCGGSER